MSQSGPEFTIEHLAEIAVNQLHSEDNFIDKVVIAAKARNVATLKSLSQQRNLLTEDSLKKNALVYLFIEEDSKSATFLGQFLQLDNLRMAEFAAQAGKRSITESYLNRVEPSKRSCVRLAAKAACGGHITDAEYYLGNNKESMHYVIEEAAYAGEKASVEHFLARMPVGKCNYEFIARCAELGKQYALAEDLRQKRTAISKAANFKKPSAVSRKSQQPLLPPAPFSKPDPMEPSLLYLQPISSLPATLPEAPPSLLHQFNLLSLLKTQIDPNRTQAPQTRKKAVLM